MNDHLLAHARFQPDAEVLVDVDADRRFTWAELLELSRRWVGRLRRAGVGAGDRVAVLAHNHGASFAVLYACRAVGAIFFPMNWRLSEAELSWQLEHAAPKVLLTDTEHIDRLDRPSLPLDVDPDDPPEGGQGSALSDPWMLLYTSGTSGRPKGALITHRQVHFNAVNTVLACGLTADSATLTFTPLFHTGGLNCLSTPMLHIGGRVVLCQRARPERDLRLVAQERITHLIGVPTIYQLLADHPDFEQADLSSVVDALCGGAPLSVDLLRRWLDRGVPLRQGFGMTEVGPNCFSMPHAAQADKLGSVGKPIHHIGVRLVREDGTDCDVGEAGELWMSGPVVFGGYLDDPEATAQAQVDGWFRSGDVLERDAEGFYRVCGRRKEMFISGGENVYPAEVETAIYTLVGVAAVVVLGVADERWGEVGHAFVQLRPGTQMTAEGLRTALQDRLARFKIPRHVTFLDALPQTGSGKIDKVALGRTLT
ncbi:MAG: AMP-binding protein [Myxococcales bacterium]|nr:AMP-binding protein [Myxococcales bacterium]